MTPPRYPAGDPPVAGPVPGADARALAIAAIARLPGDLAGTVRVLDDAQLGMKYVNWTVRQIVNHLADSHVNAYTRFRLAMTEDRPTIKPYDESAWARLTDADAEIGPSLAMLEGLHARWSRLLGAMSGSDFERAFLHPEADEAVTLGHSLLLYAWHGAHHLGQIRWMAACDGWPGAEVAGPIRMG